MKSVNGKVIEMTEYEVEHEWIDSKYNTIMSLQQYKSALILQGINIIKTIVS